MIQKSNNYELITSLFSNCFENFKLTGEDPYEKVFIYLIDEKIVGFISYSIIYERCELNYIAVIENYRKMGIASKLITSMFTISQKMGAYTISLEVNELNISAYSLYSKLGFKTINKRLNYYGNNTAIIMEKKLGD